MKIALWLLSFWMLSATAKADCLKIDDENDPIATVSGDRALFVGVCDNQARIDRKAFAANQARRKARLHNALEHPPEDSTLAKPLVAARENAE